MDRNGRVVGYARVACAGTIEASEALNGQVAALRAAGCGQVCPETGPGLPAKRPGLALLIRGLCEGDTLMVLDATRLGRDRAAVTDLVVELEARGVRVRALHHTGEPG